MFIIAFLISFILISIIAIKMYENHLNTKFEKMAFSFYYSKKDIIVQLQNYIEKQLNNHPKILSVSIMKNQGIPDYVGLRIHSNDNMYNDVFTFNLSDALKKRQNNNINLIDDSERNMDSAFNMVKLDLSEVLEFVNLMNNNDVTSIDNETGFGKVDIFSHKVTIVRILKGKKIQCSTDPPSVLKQIEGDYYYFFCSYCD
jgi:hypothetical protein